MNLSATQLSRSSGEMGDVQTRPNFGVSGGRKKTRATAAAAPAKDDWRRHLEAEAAGVARCIKSKVAVMHTVVLRRLPSTRCGRCGGTKYQRDMVPFHCAAPKGQFSQDADAGGAAGAGGAGDVRHDFCTQCVLELLKRQWETRRDLDCGESRQAVASLERSCRGRFMFVICPVCRSPNVITQSTKFCESFARERIDSRLQFAVHVGATRMLLENYCVEEMFENQRRPFFGAFSAANLFVTDFRGHYSTQDASEIEDVGKTFEKPNSLWAWVDNWSPDVRGAASNGWRYATRWDDDAGKWQTVVSLFAFVRRRRMLRTRLRLNHEVRSDLEGLYRDADEGSDADGDTDGKKAAQ